MASETTTSKKQQTAVTAAAIVLAALLVGGVTYSYLAVQDGEVENTFATDASIDVSVDETTGSDYTVIPGTSEEKDPTVTVTTSEQAYVFLIVQDNTYGLVNYSIDEDEWTLLYGDDDTYNTDMDGYNTKIYYKLVEASDDEQEINVLTDKTVSYSDDVSVLDAAGNVIEGVTLSFGAVAITAAGYDSAADAFADAYGEYTGSPLAYVYAVEAGTIDVASGIAVNSSMGNGYTYTVFGTSVTIGPSKDEGDVTLDAAYVFEATESASVAANSYYADWIADFEVSFDTSGASEDDLESWGGTVALFGQYDKWSNYWVPMTLEDCDEEGTTYKLLESHLFGNSTYSQYVDTEFTYYDLCNDVVAFQCGTVQTISSDDDLYSYFDAIDVPDGVTMTVTLKLYDPDEDSTASVECGSWSYTFGGDEAEE